MNDRIYIYQTSANQKTITTKKTLSDKDHLYGVMNVEAMLSAAHRLSDRAYKLYVRMMLHQDGHTYALSPVEINGAIGMSDKRYREAVKELIDKGYLVQNEKHKSLYTIFEYPEKDNPAFAIQTDATAVSDISHGENRQMTRLICQDDPSNSEGEIVHNITPNTTVHNTTDSTDEMGLNDTESIQNIIDEISEDISFRADIDDMPF